MGGTKGGPRTPEGKERAKANLIQFQNPGHGAYGVDAGDAAVEVLRVDIIARVEEEIGQNLRPADRVTVNLMAIALRRIELLETWLDKKGMFGKSQELRPALGMLATLLKIAREYAADLGLSPAGRAKLGIKSGQKSAIERLAESYTEADKGVKN